MKKIQVISLLIILSYVSIILFQHNKSNILKLNANQEECIHTYNVKNSNCKLGIYCELCGIVLVEPNSEHIEEIIPEIPATCVNYGYTEGRKCSVCSVVIVAPHELPLKNHVFENECDEFCNNCGSLNMTYKDHVYDHSCDDTCNICNYHRDDITHNYGPWETYTLPTKNSVGEDFRVCSNCSNIDYRYTLYDNVISCTTCNYSSSFFIYSILTFFISFSILLKRK